MIKLTKNAIFVYILHNKGFKFKSLTGNWCNVLVSLSEIMSKTTFSIQSFDNSFQSKSTFKKFAYSDLVSALPQLHISFSTVNWHNNQYSPASFSEKIIFNTLMVLFEFMAIAFLLGTWCAQVEHLYLLACEVYLTNTIGKQNLFKTIWVTGTASNSHRSPFWVNLLWCGFFFKKTIIITHLCHSFHWVVIFLYRFLLLVIVI